MPTRQAVPSGTVPGAKKIRGKSVALPGWFLQDVNARFDELKAQKLTNLSALGMELTKAVGRELVWDHKAVDLFLKGEVTTIEMMQAFLRIWPSLLQPIFIAPTRRDAERITDALRRGESNPDWRNRYLELEDKLAEVAAEVLDQTRAVASKDEGQNTAGKPHNRRPRGVD